MTKNHQSIMCFMAGLFLSLFWTFSSPTASTVEAIAATKQVGSTSDYLTFQLTQSTIKLYHTGMAIVICSLYGIGIVKLIQSVKENKSKNQTTKNEK